MLLPKRINLFTRRNTLRKWKWPVVWLVQIAAMLALGALIALSAMLGALVHGIASWAVAPVAALVSGYRTTRRGLLNYAAWIAPPVCFALANRICWGYLPSAGPVLVCALTALVGAAAGEVMNLREK